MEVMIFGVGFFVVIICILLFFLAETWIGNRCSHDWEVLREIEMTNPYGEKWYKLILVCKKCGKIKKVLSK